jgi:hypothetical protein
MLFVGPLLNKMIKTVIIHIFSMQNLFHPHFEKNVCFFFPVPWSIPKMLGIAASARDPHHRA